MAQSDRAFGGSIPELYDRFLGPLQGLPYAKETAARVAALKPKRVPETACGTGFVTRAMVTRLPPETEIGARSVPARRGGRRGDLRNRRALRGPARSTADAGSHLDGLTGIGGTR